MYKSGLRDLARNLRAKGMTYPEIITILSVNIPKGTLAGWCNGVSLPVGYFEKVKKLNYINLENAREKSIKNRKEIRKKFFAQLEIKNTSLIKFLKNNLKARKITLAILYLAEGSKSARGSLMFGNSDPLIVKMFVNLLRECYKVDESKFRCTVQCRADQDTKALQVFWSKATLIPLNQFYSTRVDKRTIGQVSRKQDYKGVCRIDYFSSNVDLELKHIAKMTTKIFE